MMSITQTIFNRMEFFQVDINDKPVVADHIYQMNLYTGIGIIGEPGEIVMTSEAFRLLDSSGMQYNPVGQNIKFMIKDPKSGDRPYDGVVTSMTRKHTQKRTLVVLAFDKPHWVRMKQVIWPKCFEKKTILEIVKEFFEAQNVPFNTNPQNQQNFRGTFWENFCTPMHASTLQYLVEELLKDNFIIFTNPDDGGIVVVNWKDLGRLDAVCENFPDYVLDKIYAKFDEKHKEWQDHTFTFGKQVDSRLPWKIQEFEGTISPDISTSSKKTHTYYTAVKRPFTFLETDGDKVEPNDIGLKEMETYPGIDFDNVKIRPYPKSNNLINDSDHPIEEYSGYDLVTQNIIHPRYMLYRMQQSYASKIQLSTISIVIPGSAKAVVPLTAIPVSYFENARVENPNENAKGDYWQSGLFLIWGSKLSIAGPNMILTLNLFKPYTVGGTDESAS